MDWYYQETVTPIRCGKCKSTNINIRNYKQNVILSCIDCGHKVKKKKIESNGLYTIYTTYKKVKRNYEEF